MKFCQHCGAEIEDEATVCIHCGCATNDVKAKSSGNTNMGKIALIFMIIGCVCNPIATFIEFLDYYNGPESFIVILIGAIFSLVSLAWCIPMTVHFSRKHKNGESVGTGFKVCTLLFVNMIAGILLLCMPQENSNK